MKLKFEYSEDEKRAILEQHNLFKKTLQSKVKRLMINEQVEDDTNVGLSGKDLLNSAIAKGCRIAVGGRIQSQDGIPNKPPFVIYNKVNYNSDKGNFKIGDELYIKDNFTFDVVSTDASGVKRMTTGIPWKCKALTAEADAAAKTKADADAAAAKTKADADAAAAKTKADADAAAAKTNLELTQKEGDWKERKNITDTDANIENPQMYEKKVVNGVTLYRRVSGKGIAGALDERQKAVVDKWVAQGAKLEKEIDAEQAKTWTKKLVSPKSDGLFSEDFYMYFPPTTITNAEITAAFQKAVQEQTPESPKDCKETIESYYTAYKKSKQIEPNMLNAMREKVQACKYEYYGSWGAFRNGDKLDEYLDYMTGSGRNADWRIKK